MKKNVLSFCIMICSLFICGFVNADNVSEIAGTYKGTLKVKLTNVSSGIVVDVDPTQESVYLTADGDHVQLTLKNFSLSQDGATLNVGNIVIPQIPVVVEGNKITLTRTMDIVIQAGDDPNISWIGPALGLIPVALNGEVANNQLKVLIEIKDVTGLNIDVDFSGLKEGSTSIGKNTNNNFSIYPSSNYEVINVNGVSEGSNYMIYNVTGSLVKSGTLNSSTTINVSNLNKGIYLVKIAGYTVKFVKR